MQSGRAKTRDDKMLDCVMVGALGTLHTHTSFC